MDETAYHTCVKNELTKTTATLLSGRARVRGKSCGTDIVFSTILCLLGSVVNGDGPATLSTIIRMSCKNDRAAESPMYTIKVVSSYLLSLGADYLVEG